MIWFDSDLTFELINNNMNKGCHGNATHLFPREPSHWFPDQGDTDEDYLNYFFVLPSKMFCIAHDIYEMANYQITSI